MPGVLGSILVVGMAAVLVAQEGARVVLVDVTREAGIAARHDNGAAGRKLLPETMGAGAAFFDYDNDGDEDLLLVNGLFPGGGGGRYATLYRNDGAGRFEDVTDSVGLRPSAGNRQPAIGTRTVRAGTGQRAPGTGPTPAARRRGDQAGASLPSDGGHGSQPLADSDPPLRYGMGVAAADMDNDGWTDIVLTSVGGVTLFRNDRGTRFVDVTTQAGLGGRQGFSTCAVWVDVDRDGLVDLLVCNYVQWSRDTDLFCSANGTQKTYCTPQAYRGSTSWLFRNLGRGKFEDITARAGLFDVTGKALGATVLDHDGDGWPDIFIANDTVPNRLYRNNHDGTFTELGLQSGVAFSNDGRARAGMGVDAADVDNSGRASVAVTNFSGEMLGLFVPQEPGVYVDTAPGNAVGRATRQTLGWGCFFFDVNLDGWQDLLVINGQLDAMFARTPGGAFAPHLFLNRQGRFEDVAASVGGAFAAPRIGRGAAFADIDNDGDPDVVVTSNGGMAQLFRNDTAPRGGVVRLRLKGVDANRDAIGTRVTGIVNGQTASRLVRTGSSYLSQSELVLSFGLGAAPALDDVVVEWPGRPRQRLGRLAAGFVYDVVEGRGVTGRTAFRR
ncbi:MAG: CRTAC1 family protein [Acidobacteria bacterium]|nr:CRTAC1 family protein [Acidobacteriota bacterium]